MANTKMVLVPHSAFTRLMSENLDKTKEYIGELGQKAETVLENPKLSAELKAALYNQAVGQQLQLATGRVAENCCSTSQFDTLISGSNSPANFPGLVVLAVVYLHAPALLLLRRKQTVVVLSLLTRRHL